MKKEVVKAVTKKMIDAEVFVDNHISEHGQPPTYQKVMEQFGLKSKSAAYLRLRRYREKMNHRLPTMAEEVRIRQWLIAFKNGSLSFDNITSYILRFKMKKYK